MSMNELMTFRTTFLRSIAEAWFDRSFRSDLLADAKKALKDRFGFVWPWEDVCNLQILDSQDQFEWIDDKDGWVYSADLKDGLTLYVPLAPRMHARPVDDASDVGGILPYVDVPADKRAMALGDYYRQYASLFSDDWGNVPSSSTAQASTPSSVAHGLIAPVIGPNSDSPVGGFIPSDEEFAAFKVALLGAIAKAWQDASFKTMLTIDASAALNTIRGYKLPWNMKIKIVENTSARWHPPGDPPGEHPSYWSQGRPNLLQLYLPNTPTDFDSQPLALATYNATGAEFPFTCTC